MVIFFFSGACAAAPVTMAAPSTIAASALMKHFISLLLVMCRIPDFMNSESPADLRRQRCVAAHLLRLHREVDRKEIHVHAGEVAALVETLLAEARAGNVA